MVLADIHALEAGMEGLGLIGVGPVLGAIGLAVVDPAPREVGVQQVVGLGLVGRDRRARGDEALGQTPDVVLV